MGREDAPRLLRREDKVVIEPTPPLIRNRDSGFFKIIFFLADIKLKLR
jgi:hypothetical protein